MNINIDTITQIAIAVFGVTAVFLSQSKSEGTRRYASIFGLLGQPFWFYMSWVDQKWGLFVLCLLYSASWFHGFWNNWIAIKRSI
jgi:hypothetical protein